MLRAATPFGLSLNTDSVYYVNGARNLLAGDGFTRTSGEGILKPITHFPPLFSSVLAFVGLGGLDPLRGGRLVIILLYGVNSLLFTWLVWKLTRNFWLTGFGALLMVFSSVNLETSSWLMSEPLYLFLMLISFLVAYYYMKNWKAITILGLGVLSGLMYLTRYVGVSMIITWLAVILLFTPGWRRKAVHAGLFLLGSLPFVSGIMLRNYRLTGSTGNRNFILHWASFEKIADGIRAFWSWILPYGSLEFLRQPALGFHHYFFHSSLSRVGLPGPRLVSTVEKSQACCFSQLASGTGGSRGHIFGRRTVCYEFFRCHHGPGCPYAAAHILDHVAFHTGRRGSVAEKKHDPSPQYAGGRNSPGPWICVVWIDHHGRGTEAGWTGVHRPIPARIPDHAIHPRTRY